MGSVMERFLLDYKKSFDPVLQKYLEKKRENVSDNKSMVRAYDSLIKISKGGKRMRGALVLLGYLASGGEDRERVIKTSLFAELLHLGLLVQDDFMDRDDIRRGEPTIHTQFEPPHFGDSMAVLVGDLTFSFSGEIILSSGFDDRHVQKAMKEYYRYFESVIEGQAMDVSASQNMPVTHEYILKVYQMKTAEYSAALPLSVGARLSGAGDRYTDKLREYGESLGMAFQIHDDVLGVYGDQGIGKPLGSDIREGKQTLLLSHFMENASQEDQGVMSSLVGSDIDQEGINLAREMFDKYGSREYVMSVSDRYIKSGKGVIKDLTKDDELRAVFSELLDFSVGRSL